MLKSDELKQLRSAKVDQITSISNAAKTEKRGFTQEERSQIEALKTEIENIDSDIETNLFLEAEEKRKAEELAAKRALDKRKKSPEGKAVKRFSWTKAINAAVEGRSQDGVEKEMFEEATREARESGISLSGAVRVPAFFKRDMTAGTTTEGGHTIQTEVGDVIPFLHPQMQVEALGATMLTGLTGNLDLPRNDGAPSAAWEGENDANAETNATFDKISLTPNRLGAFIDVSKQLLLQSTISIDAFIQRELETAIAKAVDIAAINGSGSGNQPTGILNTSGIGDVAGGTNGAVPTFDNLVDLESEVAIDNADMGALAYLTTPGIRGALKKAKIDAGSGVFVWGQNDGGLNGYNAVVSTQVPSTLTKGSSSGVCHAVIFGNWNELIIAQWGGYDLVIDPYTKAANGLVVMVANSWWDIALRHAESFAAMKDALIS